MYGGGRIGFVGLPPRAAFHPARGITRSTARAAFQHNAARAIVISLSTKSFRYVGRAAGSGR